MTVAQRFAWFAPVLTVLLLPFGSLYELGCLSAWLAVMIAIWQRHYIRAEAVRVFSIGFGAYALAAWFSLLDAESMQASLRSGLAIARWFGLGLAMAMLTPEQLKRLVPVLSWVLVFWLLDASVQALSGYGVRGVSNSERLSGIFGQDDLKLGLALAACAPILLFALRKQPLYQGMALLWLWIIVLMNGSRAAWIMLFLVSLIFVWTGTRQARLRVAPVLIASMITLAALTFSMYQFWPQFRDRVDRTVLLVHGEREQIDEALAYRLSIFETAIRMGRAHQVNGVGVRGFRTAYSKFAATDDRWLAVGGASHPHHWLLEVWSETGLFGLALWMIALLWLARHHFATNLRVREHSLPFAAGLFVMLFPLNTHLAVYSSFWGTLMMLMLALYASARSCQL
jgi:O-antigen ligase